MAKQLKSSIALAALLLACVGGHIPPSTFQFTSVVPLDGSSRSGWKIAQVVVLLGRLSPVFSESATCDVQVGVPELNLDGPVSNELAQAMAARAADAAARLVLQERQPTALVCLQFREHMQFILGNLNTGLIPGARVSGFTHVGIPRKTFP